MSTHRFIRATAILAAGITVIGLTSCAVQNTQSSDSSSSSSGLRAVPGYDPASKTITVGFMTALSGPVAATSPEQVAGQNAYWELVNKTGGIDGKYKVKLITADNQFNAQLAVQEYQKIKDKVTMLSMVLGDASVAALVPVLNQSDGVEVAGSQNAKWRTEPGVALTFTSYQTDVVNVLSSLISAKKATTSSKFCALTTVSEAGDAHVAALKYAAQTQGFSVAALATYSATDTSYVAQVQQLKAAGCEVVVFYGTSAATPAVVAAASQLNFNATWTAPFFALATAFKTSPIAGYLTDHFIFTGLGGGLDNATIPGMVNLKKVLGKTPTMQNVYGYMQGITTAAILTKAVSLGDLSGKGLRNAITKLDKITYEGLGGDVTYAANPEDRKLSRRSNIFAYSVDAPDGYKELKVGYEAPSGTDPKW